MKSRYYLLLLLFGIALNLFSQSIVFSYDEDGNMESRYMFTLRSAQVSEQIDEVDEIDEINEQIDEIKPEIKEIFSVALANQQITIYPNPTQGEIYVEIAPLNSKEENLMRLFDSSGRLIETKKIESERTHLTISGSAGVYFLNIHLGTNTSKWKIIKQ